jgi:Tol biopolymer transport system component
MPADRDAGAADVSADGRYVAFESKARNLSPIAGEVMNVYLYDTKRKRIELVSRNGRKGANDKSQDPAVSRNGRYVAFGSRAGNLPGPPQPNVYVYDAKRNRVELVSRQSRSDGGRPADAWSEVSDISADGNVVSFTTTAGNLGGPIDSRKNVYVYDRRAHRVQLVSRQSAVDGGNGGNHAALSGSYLSLNGRRVAFTSKATNLGGPTKSIFRGYVYDRKRDRVRPIAPRADRRDSYSYPEAISGDGRKVAFYVNSGTFGSGSFVYNLRSGDRRRVGGDTVDLSLDGRFAAGVDQARKRVNGRRIVYSQVFRLNLRSGRRTIASEPIHRPDRNDLLSEAWEPSISGSGRAIAFTSGVRPPAGGGRPPVPNLVFLRRYR